MKPFEYYSDRAKIQDDISKMRGVDYKLHRAYVVYDSVSGSVDTIFNEPVDPFSTTGAVTVYDYYPVNVLVVGNSKTSDYLEAGLTDRQSITIEVSSDVDSKQSVEWKAGLMMMIDSILYRITTIEPRGIYGDNRLVLELSKVT